MSVWLFSRIVFWFIFNPNVTSRRNQKRPSVFVSGILTVRGLRAYLGSHVLPNLSQVIFTHPFPPNNPLQSFAKHVYILILHIKFDCYLGLDEILSYGMRRWCRYSHEHNPKKHIPVLKPAEIIRCHLLQDKLKSEKQPVVDLRRARHFADEEMEVEKSRRWERFRKQRYPYWVVL